MNPGYPSGVANAGDCNRSKLLLADGDQRGTGGADTGELELTFGIRAGEDHLRLAGQRHPGSCHRHARHTEGFSV